MKIFRHFHFNIHFFMPPKKTIMIVIEDVTYVVDSEEVIYNYYLILVACKRNKFK